MRFHFFNSAVIATLKMDYWLEPTKPRPILLTGSRSANFPRARRLLLYLKEYLNLVHQTIPCKETYCFIDISGAQEQVSKTHSDVNYSVRRKQTQWNESNQEGQRTGLGGSCYKHCWVVWSAFDRCTQVLCWLHSPLYTIHIILD